MKRKRFYNNKRRSKKWTEKPVGRKIYFADKYITDFEESNKYNAGKKTKKPLFTKDRLEKFAKLAITIVCCIVTVGTGYTLMDIHLERNAMPYKNIDTSDNATLNNITLNIRGTECHPLSLDGGIMARAVIETAFENGYSSIAFDLKRDDGTIGYNSQLATISAYGAISSPSGDLAGSVKLLEENDILPIGRISCYKDNVAPNADLASAVFVRGSLYKDSSGSTYLNPNSTGAYNYIRSIVDEAIGLGISVFVLDNYKLPDKISEKYNDGFDALAERLYADFNDEIKLYKAYNINFTSENAKALNEEWKEKTEKLDKSDNSTMLYVTAKKPEMVKQFLNNKGITNYIISE